MDTLEHFENYLQTHDYADISIKGYVSDVRYFANWFEKHTAQQFAVEVIRVGDIQDYRQVMLANKLAPSTINRRLAALNALCKWGVEAGLLEQNPGLHIRGLDAVSLAPKWLDKNQRAAYIRTINDELANAKERYPRLWVMRLRDAAILLTLLNTGLRVMEVCTLGLDDVSISDRKGSLSVTGKGFKQRTIPLNKVTREILAQWLAVHPARHLDRVFVNQRGDLLKPNSVRRAVRRVAHKAGLGYDITPHMLRHTFAKTLLDEGVSLEKVATLLGHSNLNTTRIYTTPSERDLEDAVGRL